MERLKKLNRRDFLKWGARAAAGLGLTLAAGGCGRKKETPTPEVKPTESLAEALETIEAVGTRLEATKTSKASATLKPTVRAVEETPTPTASTVLEVETPKSASESLPTWPETTKKAASLFGGSPDRWEKNPDGGWHLREEAYRTQINPHGYLMEGYYDTKPGKNPLCIASAGVEVEIQGGTIWSERGTEETAKGLQEKMAIPIWDDGKQHPCQVILPDCPE